MDATSANQPKRSSNSSSSSRSDWLEAKTAGSSGGNLAGRVADVAVGMTSAVADDVEEDEEEWCLVVGKGWLWSQE